MKKCPKCGKINGNVNFCKYCGTSLKDVSVIKKSDKTNKKQSKQYDNDSDKQPTREELRKKKYSNQWEKANQSMTKFSSYSNGYFSWLKDSFLHPSKSQIGHPYFGFISFGITAIILMLSAFMNGGSYADNMSLSGIVGYLPFKAFDANMSNIYSTNGVLLGILVSIIALIAIAFVFGGEKNIYKVANKLSHITNINIIMSILVLFTISAHAYEVTSVLSSFMAIFYIVGLTIYLLKQKSGIINKLGKIYTPMLAFIAWKVIQYIAVAILGMLFVA